MAKDSLELPTLDQIDEQFNALENSPIAVPAPAIDRTPASAPSLAGSEPPPGLIADLEASQKEEQYGTAGQMALTALEGAASAATFGLSRGAERLASSALGIDSLSPEAQKARMEVNPGSQMAGEAAGLIGSSLIPGVGAANLLERGGAAIAERVISNRLGSAAVKAAAENAMYQVGNEVGKMFVTSPAEVAETALVDIGLSAVLGGVIGGGAKSAGMLWEATAGKETKGLLGAIKKKLGGIEGVVDDEIDQLAEATGMDLKPEVKAMMSSDPEIRVMAQRLAESQTAKGIGYKEALKQTRSESADLAVKALGRAPEDLAALSDVSEYELGANIKKSLIKQVKDTVDPISNQFENLKGKYKKVELTDFDKADITDRLTQLADEKGWLKSPSSPEYKLWRRTVSELDLQKSIDDLAKFETNIAQTAKKEELYHFGSQVSKIFREAEDMGIDRAIGANAPELISEMAGARTAYKGARQMLEALDERLNVGHWKGPDSFVHALKEMTPEDIIKRLSPKGDAGVIPVLMEKYPEAGEQIRKYYLDKVLKAASNNPPEGFAINMNTLTKQLKDMSPEMRNFLVPQEAQVKLAAIEQLMSHLPNKPLNPPATAPTLLGMMRGIPGTASGMAAWISGTVNPVLAALVGEAGMGLTRHGMDAMRLATLKFLGTGKNIDTGAFRAAAQYAQQVIKAENLVGKSVKNVFKAGTKVLPEAFHPTQDDRDKLEKNLKKIQDDQALLLNMTSSKLSHYMPEQSTAIASTTQSVSNYLNSLRPDTSPQAPLDPPMVPSSEQQGAYNRALDIAQQPLILLDSIKDNSLTQSDVTAIQQMYPALYQKLNKQLMEGIVASKADEEPIPYNTRMSLSVFMGIPLDSTMTASAINAAQLPAAKRLDQATNAAAQAHEANKAPPASSMKSLAKAPTRFLTPQEASQKRQLEG